MFSLSNDFSDLTNLNLKLQEKNLQLEEKCDNLLTENKRLKKKLEESVMLPTRKRKAHFSTSEENQRVNKIEIISKIRVFNKYLNNFDLQLKNIDIFKTDQNDLDKININFKMDSTKLNKCEETLDLKDSFNISDLQYTQMRKKLQLNLSSLYSIKKKKRSLKIFSQL